MPVRPEIPADLYYDPYDPELDKDPYPVWKRMRDEAPLYYNEKYDFYALSRYEDVQKGLQNWQDFSSARGTLLEIIRTGPEGAADNPFGDGNLGMLIFSDPPGHDIARRLVVDRFSPRAVQAFEARARALANHFLDQVEGRSEFDLVDDIIRPIPPMMIGHILGVPEEDQAELGRLVDESLAFDPTKGADEIVDGVRQGNEAHMAIARYLGELVAKRASNPTDDLASLLVKAELNLPGGVTRKLDLNEVISFFMLLQSAGSEPPTPIQARYVMRDVEWHGYTIPADSKVAFLNGSAGRDERQYEDPDRFDIDRKQPLRHLSFGFGTHVCLGSSLARLELRVVLEELLKRYPEWDVDESQIEMVLTTTVRGPVHVPVKV